MVNKFTFYFLITEDVLLYVIIIYLNQGFQEAERKIPLNYASRYMSRGGGLQKSAYLPFKVCFPASLFLLSLKTILVNN